MAGGTGGHIFPGLAAVGVQRQSRRQLPGNDIPAVGRNSSCGMEGQTVCGVHRNWRQDAGISDGDWKRHQGDQRHPPMGSRIDDLIPLARLDGKGSPLAIGDAHPD